MVFRQADDSHALVILLNSVHSATTPNCPMPLQWYIVAAHSLATLHPFQWSLCLCLTNSGCHSHGARQVPGLHSRVLFIHESAETLAPSRSGVLYFHQDLSCFNVDGSCLCNVLSCTVPSRCDTVDVFLPVTRFHVIIQHTYCFRFRSDNHFFAVAFVLLSVIFCNCSCSGVRPVLPLINNLISCLVPSPTF